MENKYAIDGREIVIRTENPNLIQPLLFQTILDVCKKNEHAKVIPLIVFILEEDGEALGWVDDEDLILELPRIHLNLGGIQKAKYTSQRVSLLTRAIVHELAHLWDNFISKELKRTFTTQKRLSAALQKEVTGVEIEKGVREIRDALFLFLRTIRSEGLAVFCEKQVGLELPFDEETFTEIYEDSQDFAISLHNYFLVPELIFVSFSKEGGRKLWEAAYVLGLHAVYTIIYIKKHSFEYIAKMQPFDFIKEYEECMAIKGLQPVISVTSGKGILDYKKMLAQLTAAAKEVQKRSSK